MYRVLDMMSTLYACLYYYKYSRWYPHMNNNMGYFTSSGQTSEGIAQNLALLHITA